MKWLEKDLSLDERQTVDLILWLCIILSGGSIIFCFKLGVPIMFPTIPFLISFYLMYRNNKIALKEIKKNKEESKK